MSQSTSQSLTQFQWRSRSVFILVMVGVTLSMKDFLIFPVMVAEHGGGAYILLYAACLIVLGLPLLLAETLIGRESKALFINNLSHSFDCSRHWHWIIGLSLIACVLLLSVYNVIAGLSLSFVFKSSMGLFEHGNKELIESLLVSFQADPERMMLWHTWFILVLLLISAQGIKHGVQKVFVIIVPTMVLLLIVGLSYAMMMGDYMKSVEYLLLPDFSKINLSVLLIALQQAFYTLSVGLGIFIIFGSKLSDDVPLVYSGFIIVLIDILFSIFIGLSISAFVFSLDTLPSIEDELAFSLLPLIFSQLPFGQFFGTLFYVLLTVAAITTAIALLEVFVSFLQHKYRFTRIKSVVLASLVTWFIGIMAIFSYTVWVDFGFTIEMTVAGDAYRLVNEAGFQDVIIYIASHLLQPFVAFLMIVFIAWVVKKEMLQQMLKIEHQQTFEVVYFMLRYITPSLIFVVWLSAIGIIRYA